MKLTSALLSPLPCIRHGFFTREGGVSGGIYASLNCGSGSGDALENVMENRRRVAAEFGRGTDDLVTLSQVHGREVVVLDDPIIRLSDDKRGCGSSDHRIIGKAQKADGIVTNQPGVIIGVLTADCAPILLADSAAGIIGAAHAGWKGALAGIIGATVDAMVKLGAERENITAAIGPCIGRESYEVDADFLAPFLEEYAGNRKFFVTPQVQRDGRTPPPACGRRLGGGCPSTRVSLQLDTLTPTLSRKREREPSRYVAPGELQFFSSPIIEAKHLFDLKSYVAHKLADAGVIKVDTLANDTFLEESRFFSYRRATHRREPDYGRQVSAIMLVA